MMRFTLESSIILLLLCLPKFQTALAQAVGADQYANEPEIEEIIVTGTRIKRLDYLSASPLVTVDSTLFEQSGSPNVQTMLNTLPQFTPWLTDYTNNRTGPNPAGQAIMDLRGLGLGRSLVLLDGQRVVPSNGYGAVDVNLIPTAIVERVEVITGGASAVYGSDAIAGVVNFKTRRFTGLQVDASWAQTDKGDGNSWNAGFTGGLEFSRGYAYGHLSYAQRDPVMQGDRGFSQFALGYDDEIGEFLPLGSSNIRQGRWNQTFSNRPTQEAIDEYFAAADPSYTPGAVRTSSLMGFNPDGSPFSIEPVYNFTGDTDEPLQPVNPFQYSYNYAPFLYLRLPMKRTNFFGRAGFDLTADSELFLQLLWANYTPDRQLAPTPLGGVWVGADNPHIHPALAAILGSRPDPSAPFQFSKRMSDTGPRRLEADYEVTQLVLGAKGRLGFADDWDYDAYASWGGVDLDDRLFGTISRSAFEDLSMAPDAGASICGGSGMDPFGIGSISAECAAYMRRDGIEQTSVRQIVGEASFSGPVVSLPAGELRAALGIFYKQDRFETVPDESFSALRIDPVTGRETPDSAGINVVGETIAGKVESKEVFVEVNLPFLTDAPFARTLEAAFGYRYADHSNAGAINAWKAETIWQISEPLTLRSSYQEAVRAPDFYALFEPQKADFSSWGFSPEPCDSTFEPLDGILGAPQDPAAATLCVAQGIPEDVLPDYLDTNRGAESLEGGNPNLAEETADTFTAGFVIRPSKGILAGLQASIDYYRIEVDDIVAYIGNGVFSCFDRAVNPNLSIENVFCQRFRRDPATYQITDIVMIPINLAEMSVSGYDLQFDYALDAGPGRLSLHGVASYAESATEKTGPAVPEQDYAGKATGTAVTAQTAFFSLVPKLKLSADARYSLGAFDVDLRWRYVDGVEDSWINSFRVPSRQYYDLTLGFAAERGFLDGLVIRAGVTNLTNEDPPIYPSSVEANTESSTYDVLGRRYFVRMNYRFGAR